MVSWTVSINKSNGKVIFWPLEPRPSNGIAQFYSFSIDLKNGTINLIGRTGTVQHYADDGRQSKLDPLEKKTGQGLKPDPGQLFDSWLSKKRGYFLISEMKAGRQELELYAKKSGITDGKMIRRKI